MRNILYLYQKLCPKWNAFLHNCQRLCYGDNHDILNHSRMALIQMEPKGIHTHCEPNESHTFWQIHTQSTLLYENLIHDHTRYRQSKRELNWQINVPKCGSTCSWQQRIRGTHGAFCESIGKLETKDVKHGLNDGTNRRKNHQSSYKM